MTKSGVILFSYFTNDDALHLEGLFCEIMLVFSLA